MVFVDSWDLYFNILVFVLYKYLVICIFFFDMFMCIICSVFLVSGLIVLVVVSFCVVVLWKVCEDFLNFLYELIFIVGFLWIGEVFYFIFCGFVLNLIKF